jgi:photosystem II stability/assembly factor-like uncharacterized protein
MPGIRIVIPVITTYVALVIGVPARAQWIARPQVSGSRARLRGLCVVNPKVVWASGTEGTVLRTANAGEAWQSVAVLGGAELDLRDIHAFNDQTAWALSIGEGEKSRIYRTTDGR